MNLIPVTSSPFIIGPYSRTISANTSNYNVYTAFVAKYAVPPASVVLEVTVNPGVVVSASSTATAAMVWGTAWTGTPLFTLINNGTIVGKGGNGAYKTNSATDGGPALTLSAIAQAVSIINQNGSIFGGGGGGGKGGFGNFFFPSGGYGSGDDASFGNGAIYVGSSNGGGGAPGGIGSSSSTGFFAPTSYAYIRNSTMGDQALSNTLGYITVTPAFQEMTVSQLAGVGVDGSTSTFGVGGHSFIAFGTLGNIDSGSGGNGGDFGASGNSGNSPTVSTYDPAASHVIAGGTGGGAGRAIYLNGGTVNFISGSASPHVKGAVS
jgi:hypothetical protein